MTIPGFKSKSKRCQQLLEANSNSTQLLRIYLGSELSAKNILMRERLSSKSLDWILGEIKTRFQQSLVVPGEMVGSIAAQGMGEPAT